MILENYSPSTEWLLNFCFISGMQKFQLDKLNIGSLPATKHRTHIPFTD